ncbi:uncharacterized protein LOC128556418 [Mercenaria mercenaria]|uniref:uncharacterized protein LOC128556418 n=1 Tax=Mercenaria mercenaria TaxID=6596 RepID=UPI00234EE7AD|nr:uncharacterized protein LOC128556418 [Mercenaria mercenaria]
MNVVKTAAYSTMENYTFANNYTTGEESNENGITEATRYVFICFMVLIIVVGIPGNTIVVAVLSKLRERTSTDYFVLAMSGIDLFSATVNTICYIIRYEPSIWIYLASNTFCRLHLFSLGLANICTTMLFSAIAFDRLRLTRSTSTRPLPSDSENAKRITFGIVILSFVFSIAFPLTTTFDSTTLSCTRLDGHETIILHSILVLIYAFLFVAVIVCYTRIVIILRHHHRRIRDMNTNTTDQKADRSKFTWTKKSKIEPINAHQNKPSTSKGISRYTRKLEGQGTLPRKESMQKHAQNMNISAATKDPKTDTTHHVLNMVDSRAKGTNFTVSFRNNIVSIDEQTQRKNTCFREPQPPYSVRPVNSIMRDRKRINRTTLMMFMITLVYVGTWIINWVASIYGTVTDSRMTGLVFLSLKLYMINNTTNPVFYIIMSSKFKQNAKALFCK